MLYDASFALGLNISLIIFQNQSSHSNQALGIKEGQAFSGAEESELEECTLAASKLCYGLSKKYVRSLTNSIKNNVTVPAVWYDNQHACGHSLNKRTHYPFALRRLGA
jgi:hypothetical protein